MVDSPSANADSTVTQTTNNEPRQPMRPPALLQSQRTPVPSPANSGPPSSSQEMASLREFLRTIDGYTPIPKAGAIATILRLITRVHIPDAVTSYYLAKAGLPPAPQTDERIARLLAFATQKFIADVAADAFLHSRFRSAGNAGSSMSSYGAAAGPVVPGHLGGRGDGASLSAQRPGCGGSGQGGIQNKAVLTMEDVGVAVREYGVSVERGDFYR
ncbi:hypothetical protein Purlil1_13389 [Purpureocillium lilacinum]|uniref:Transcription initiation factor TFIID subunit 10 n=1 Tax=Purpureocillium lilacinum TaxID=33203 RepID=A0ABR0BE91_PURLI|nr:hypothetical protein Purlil1_13389 [Purpureocillium lilacinum]